MFDQFSGATRLFPIIGDPVKYAQSPVRLTRTFADRGHNGLCVPLQVRQEDLDVVMAGLTASLNVDGMLVTMPHKYTAFAYCTTRSERAKLLQVVSVIRRNPDRTWHGDGLAFVKAQQDHGAHLDGARALLGGAGGAAQRDRHRTPGCGCSRARHPRCRSVAARCSCRPARWHRRESGGGRAAGSRRLRSCVQRRWAWRTGIRSRSMAPYSRRPCSSAMTIAGHGVTPFLAAAQAAGCKTADGGHMVDAVQDVMADFLLDHRPH